MRSVWHLLFLLAVSTGRFRCMLQDCAAEMRALGLALGQALGPAIKHAAIDLAHWLPNMPRDHETI